MYVPWFFAKPSWPCMPCGFPLQRQGRDAPRIPRAAEEQEHAALPVRAFGDRWAASDAGGIAARTSRRPGRGCDYRGHARGRGEALARIGSQATAAADGVEWTMAS